MAVNPEGELWESAREWARLGFHVFPILPGLKNPAIKDWTILATTDLAQIDKWWGEADYNIGVVPALSGMWVLDCDGPVGVETLARLEAHNKALPSTLKVQTPRGPGHTHHWFTGVVPNSVGTKLGAKLDTRGGYNGRYGYVLVPPSRTLEGSYSYIGETDEIAEAPEWITKLLATQKEKHEAQGDITLDDGSNIERARAYLSTVSPAIEGSGGDNRTYQVVCGLHDFGLTEDTARTLLLEIYNPRCVPSWTKEELETKIHNAWNYAQNELGAYQQPSPQEAFKDFRVPEEVKPVTRKRFTLLDETEMALLKPNPWLLKDLIQERSLCLMYGKYESFKSFLALDIALTLASGVSGWDCPARPSPTPVVYAPSEGQVSLALQRKPAWKIAHNIVDVIPFYAFEDVPLVNDASDLIAFAEGIKAKGVQPKLIVLDTVANALTGLDEDSRGFGIFIQAMKELRNMFECAILAVHHEGKDSKRGARGGTALPAGFDTMLHVEARQTTRTVAVTVEKQKDAPKRKKPYCFQGEVVANSLVFRPMDANLYKSMNSQDETLGPEKVGQALHDLGAVNNDATVTLHVLASHLCERMPSDGNDEYERSVKGHMKELTALAKGTLAAFVTKDGRWRIPSPAKDEEYEF